MANLNQIIDYQADILNGTNPLLKVNKQSTGNFTVQASKEFSRTLTVNVPTGYKLLGVLGFTSSHNQSVWIGSISVGDSSISLAGRNVGTGAFNDLNITLSLLFGQSSAF